MSQRSIRAEEAQIAADIAAEHAEKAVAAADAAELTAARETSESGRACPDCKGPLVQHGDENPFKAGCWHCDQCGACWLPGIREKR